MLKRDKIFFELIKEVEQFIEDTNKILDSDFQDDSLFPVTYHMEKTEMGEDRFKSYWAGHEQAFIKDRLETSYGLG